MTYPAPVEPKLRAELEKEDEDVLQKLESKKSRTLDLIWPKPTEGDILDFRARMESQWNAFHAQVNDGREQRYQRDTLHPKWARQMEGDQRIFSRLSHNEILRVVADQVHNPIRIDIPPASDSESDKDRAAKRKRWANALMPYLERRAPRPIRPRFKDAQIGDGLAAYEVYMTDSYDDIDFDEQEVDDLHDVTDSSPKQRPESSREYNKRTEKEMRQAGLPLGIRVLDPLAMYYDEDDDGLRHIAIVELKNMQHLFEYLVKRLGVEETEKLRLPRPGDTGVPNAQYSAGTGGQMSSTSLMPGSSPQQGPWTELTESVETIRYYDRRWYAYMVAGQIVEGPIEHNMGEVPVFPAPGIVTASPQMTESFEGVTYGMLGLEHAVNDLLTLSVDSAFTYNRPHPVITTEKGGQPIIDPTTKQAAVLDLSDPRKVKQLGPGQDIKDAYGDFKPTIPQESMAFLMQLFERNGRNPLLSGQSPGSDASGYAMNSLMATANTLYEQPLDHEAQAYGRMMDFIFRFIRDNVRQPVYIPVTGSGRGAITEWMSISPDDIDDTPCMATIDPLSDANRLALRQSLTQGWKDGLISRRRVQQEGFAIEDAEAEDDEIIEELAQEKVSQMAIDAAMTLLQMDMLPPQASSASGTTIDDPLATEPPPPKTPTVGKSNQAASQGPTSPRALPTATARAGQPSSPTKVNQLP